MFRRDGDWRGQGPVWRCFPAFLDLSQGGVAGWWVKWGMLGEETDRDRAHPGGEQRERASSEVDLDLRLLEPPGPFVAAMEALRRLRAGEKLTLHTRFRPVHLLEHLEGSEHTWKSAEVAPLHWVTELELPPARGGSEGGRSEGR